MGAGTGAKWGALVGLLDGLIVDALIYSQREYIRQVLYQTIQEAVARQGVATTPSQIQAIVSISTAVMYVAAVLGPLVIMAIVGAIMGAVWRRLGLPWYSKGAIFGLALVAIGVASSLASPGAAAYISWLSYAQWALDFASAIAIAYLIERAKK
nr:MAG: hypothetical protein TU35_07655 [Thermoproteus sp. AZ2]